MNLILMGAPGAGKGTQSAKISEKYQIPAIATGDILRAELKAGTELGKEAQTYLELGQLVPDSVVIGIIKKYMVENNCENGFLLDGFPYDILIIFQHIGSHRITLARRFVQHAHIPNSAEAHMQGTRDGCCRQGEHIHLFAQFFQLFLVGYPEPLFLVNDQQAQFMKVYGFAQLFVKEKHIKIIRLI